MTDAFLLELKEQRKVVSDQHSELSAAITDMTKSVSELTVVACSEERHLRQDDGLI